MDIKPKILIVDDEKDSRTAIQLVLASVEAECICVSSGEAAIEQVGEHDFALCLLDVCMPGMDGFRTLELIREQDKGKNLPVLFITALDGKKKESLCRGYELGACDYILKPFEACVLLGKVNTFLDFYNRAIKLKDEIARREDVERDLEEKAWGLNKTNEAIRLLYKELEKKNMELQKLDWMKSDFVSTVSHELRTPLTIMKEGILLISDKILGEVNEQQQDMLSKVIVSVERLNNIINDLLDISKIESGRIMFSYSEENIVDLINDVCESFVARARRNNIRFTWTVPDAMPHVFCDYDKIVQVLTNLLGNAIKFTQEAGTVSVAVTDAADKITVAISDTGIGVAQDAIPRLFEKFQQFGRIDGPGEKGTGLGLAISKKIIDLHSGRIWAESKPNEGSTFSFALPRYASSEAMAMKLAEEKLLYLKNMQKNPVLSVVCMHFLNAEDIKVSFGEDMFKEIIRATSNAIQGHLTGTGNSIIPDLQGWTFVILPGMEKEDAKKVAGEIEHSMEKNGVSCRNHKISVILRSTIACYPEDAVNGKKLIESVYDNRERL